MKREEFNQWREQYREMTFKENQEWYDRLEKDHPWQQHFDATKVADFIRHTSTQLGSVRILELGGWKGDLAEIIRKNYPNVWSNIVYWDNHDICLTAIEKNVCHDPKYNAFGIDRQLWELAMLLRPYNIFIGSHVLEHLTTSEIKQLIPFLVKYKIQYLYLHVPITEQALGEKIWNNYYGNHILEIGWVQLEQLLRKYKYTPLRKYHDHIRTFKYEG